MPVEKSDLYKLLEILMAQRREEVIERRWSLPSGWGEACRKHERIKECRHRKGGRVIRSADDFNVSLHTFINGEERIKCLNHCGFEVWNRPEWSFKWQFGLKMVERSRNLVSSSETVVKTNPSFISNAPTSRPYTHSLREDDLIDIGDERPEKTGVKHK